MVEEKYISPRRRTRAQAEPLRLHLRRDPPSIAPYFLEEVRKYLEREYGSQRIYQGGLRVYTTLDPTMQRGGEPRGARRACARSTGARAASCAPDGQRRSRTASSPSASTSTTGTGRSRPATSCAAWCSSSERALAVVQHRRLPGAGAAPTEIAWTRRTQRRRGAAARRRRALPDRVAVDDSGDAQGGAGRARAGARGGGRAAGPRRPRRARCGPWWAATTSSAASSTAPPRPCRQVGSAFKPIVYAAAIEKAGYTPATIIVDAPDLLPATTNKRLVAAQLRLHVLGPDPAAARARAEPEHPRHQDAAGGRHRDRRSSTRTSSGLAGELPPYLPLATRRRRGARSWR